MLSSSEHVDHSKVRHSLKNTLMSLLLVKFADVLSLALQKCGIHFAVKFKDLYIKTFYKLLIFKLTLGGNDSHVNMSLYK